MGYDIHYNAVKHWLHLHPACFKAPYPDRWVNNIYFDTYHYSAFSENLSGSSSRTKIRYRWYGMELGPATGVLEIKCKRNYYGWKERHRVMRVPYHPGANWYSIRNELLSQLPPHGRRWLQENPLPALINRYHREYFVSSDGMIRVTIDDKQAVWDQRFKPYPNFIHRANLPQTLVVEFKFSRNNRDLASRILQGFPIRVSRHSKYINGVRAISGI